MEKLYGFEDVIVVRIVVIEKAKGDRMSEYQWQPAGPPSDGSTTFSSETFYLVRKLDQMYCRVKDYEILST
jgi:hypothetical protein